jgi:hypothetical protein
MLEDGARDFFSLLEWWQRSCAWVKQRGKVTCGSDLAVLMEIWGGGVRLLTTLMETIEMDMWCRRMW